MPRWNATISHTQQQTAAVVPFCTAITMQYNSYAIRSQSVLATNSTGRVYIVQGTASTTSGIACLHNFFRHTNGAYDITYQLLGSQLWIVLSTENSRSPATAIDCEVSKATL